MKKFLLGSCLLVASFGIATSAQAFSFYDEVSNGDLSGNRLTPTQLGSLDLGTNTLKATFNGGATTDRDYFSFTIPQGQVLSEINLRSWSTSPVPFEDIAFIAIEEGLTFDFDFGGASQLNQSQPALGLLGWSHLRSTQVDTNKVLIEMSESNLDPITSGYTDVINAEVDSDPYYFITDPNTKTQLERNLRNLGRIGSAATGNGGWFPGAKGFDVPLGPGDYSIWLRQGTATKMSVELDFTTEQETPPAQELATTPEPGSILGLVTVLGLAGLRSRKK